MNIFDLSALVVCITSIMMFINYKYLKLPMTIGVMLLSLIFSLFIFIYGSFNNSFALLVIDLIKTADFNATLMGGMLSFLLFAGSLHINLDNLIEQKAIISILATLGVVFSTFLIGSISFYVFTLLGLQVGYLYCLLFGALISPTDPIAVLGILKETDAPKSLETSIAGESLFNDGVGIVVFTVILSIIEMTYSSSSAKIDVSSTQIFMLFAEEAMGGIIFGLLLGYIFYLILKSVDNYSLEIMLTLALVMGGYSISHYLHISGPLAMVVSGLFIGNHGKMFAMSTLTHKQLFSFWELIDEFLNAFLFVLIGFQILAITFNLSFIIASTTLIPIILIIRYAAISISLFIASKKNTLPKGSDKIMTWCGLRGGISIALALSLPDFPNHPEVKPLLISITFIIVAFSILVQGLTSKKYVDSVIDA